MLILLEEEDSWPNGRSCEDGNTDVLCSGAFLIKLRLAILSHVLSADYYFDYTRVLLRCNFWRQVQCSSLVPASRLTFICVKVTLVDDTLRTCTSFLFIAVNSVAPFLRSYVSSEFTCSLYLRALLCKWRGCYAVNWNEQYFRSGVFITFLLLLFLWLLLLLFALPLNLGNDDDDKLYRDGDDRDLSLMYKLSWCNYYGPISEPTRYVGKGIDKCCYEVCMPICCTYDDYRKPKWQC